MEHLITRDEVLKEILSIPNNNILCEIATGFGKSKIAIELIKNRNISRVLIVVPRNVLKQNWIDELKKWECDAQATFTTYVSLYKYADNWEAVIFDECHHLSERCREALKGFTIQNSILLSATVKKPLKWEIKKLFPDIKTYQVTIKQAIESNQLPDPKVILVPLELDNTKCTETLIINPKAPGNPVEIPYSQIWTARKTKNTKFKVLCTQRQYYNEISNAIEWYKKKSMGGNTAIKNIWLHKCGERLKWLSNLKNEIVYHILQKYKRKRTLVFCNSIEQTEILGRYCVNSKNKYATSNLSRFNEGKISHITAVNMLNEGINLYNCQVGIYACLNSSEIMIKQKLGRLLRHKDPIVIIPYYKNTRDEEIVKKMLEDYNPELVTSLNYNEL